MDNGLGSLLDIVAEMARKGLGVRTTWDYMVRPLFGRYLPLQVRITFNFQGLLACQCLRRFSLPHSRSTQCTVRNSFSMYYFGTLASEALKARFDRLVSSRYIVVSFYRLRTGDESAVECSRRPRSSILYAYVPEQPHVIGPKCRLDLACAKRISPT